MSAFVNPGDVAEVFELPVEEPMDEAQIDEDLKDYQDDDENNTAESGDLAAADSSSAAGDEPYVLSDDSVQGFFGHSASIFCLAIHPNPEYPIVCTGDGDNKAFLWDYSNGSMVQELKSHSDSVTATQFSAGGIMLATAGMDGIINIYERNTNHTQAAATATASGDEKAGVSDLPWRLVRQLEGPSQEIEWIQWHPVNNSHFLACGSADSTVSLFNAKTGDLMQAFSGHSGSCSTGSFTSDGKLLVSGGEDGHVFLWSPKTGQAKHHYKRHHNAPITALAVGKSKSTSSLITTGDLEGIMKVMNVDSGKIVWTLRGHTDSIESLDYSPDSSAYSGNKFLASASSDGTAKVWDLNSGSTRITVTHDESVIAVRFHPVQPILFSASVDRSIKATDPRSGIAIFRFLGHSESILAMEISASGDRFITVSDDQIALVFDSFTNQNTANEIKERKEREKEAREQKKLQEEEEKKNPPKPVEFD